MPKRMKGSKFTGVWGGRRGPQPQQQTARQVIRSEQARGGHKHKKVTLAKLTCLEDKPDGR
jgi:hypothetical protein